MARQFYIPGVGVVNAPEDGREWYLSEFGVLNETDTVGVPSSTKWRILIINLQGGLGHSNVAIAEMEMHSSIGGTDQCTGGTATASGNIGGGFEADKAFDDNAATMWNSGTPVGAWLQYEFASAKTIAEYSIKARESFLNDSPVAWQIEYWDGAAWQGVDLVLSEAAWSASEVRTYAVLAAKKAWWIKLGEVQGGVGHGNGAIAEMQMRTSPGGSDECTGGAADATDNIGSGFEADKAFDNDAATMWNVATPIGKILKYEFAAAKDIVEYTIQARASFLADSPVTWTLNYFDGTQFQIAHSVVDEPDWAGGETRTYSMVTFKPSVQVIT